MTELICYRYTLYCGRSVDPSWAIMQHMVARQIEYFSIFNSQNAAYYKIYKGRGKFSRCKYLELNTTLGNHISFRFEQSSLIKAIKQL